MKEQLCWKCGKRMATHQMFGFPLCDECDDNDFDPEDMEMMLIGKFIDAEANIDIEIDQTLYPKPDWADHQIVRASGLVEDICEHGIGHPNIHWLKLHDPNSELGLGIHGCDGCCCK